MGLLSQERIELLDSWRRSGFSVHNRVVVHPRDQREFEALVRYMMRPPVSLGRLHFTPGSYDVLCVPRARRHPTDRRREDRRDGIRGPGPRPDLGPETPSRALLRRLLERRPRKRKKADAPSEPSSPDEAPLGATPPKAADLAAPA